MPSGSVAFFNASSVEDVFVGNEIRVPWLKLFNCSTKAHYFFKSANKPYSAPVAQRACSDEVVNMLDRFALEKSFSYFHLSAYVAESIDWKSKSNLSVIEKTRLCIRVCGCRRSALNIYRFRLVGHSEKRWSLFVSFTEIVRDFRQEVVLSDRFWCSRGYCKWIKWIVFWQTIC